MSDADQIDQIEQTLFTAGYARLLGWCGASLATVGMSLQFGPDTAAKLACITAGLIGMVGHTLISRLNLKKAMKATPPELPSVKMISLPPSLQTPVFHPASNTPIPK